MVFGENVQDHEWPDAVGAQGPFGGYGPTIMAIAWMEFALATLLLSLRIFTRYYVQKNGGWALSWTAFSWIVGFISQVIFSVVVHNSVRGFDNEWTVPRALVLTWVSIYLTFLAIAVGKCAVVAFILALQGPTHLPLRYFLYGLAASNVIIDVVCVLVLAFRCSSPHDMYVLELADKCTSNFPAARAFAYFTGAWNAASDVVLAMYPLFLFHNIQITRHVKVGICSVMGLGIITCGTAIVKTWDFQYVNNTSHLTYQLYCILTWSYTEMWCVIITCSIPPLWPLAKRALASGRSKAHSTKEWVGSHTSSSGTGSWSRKRSKRNTMTLLGNGDDFASASSRHLASRGRSGSIEADGNMIKPPNPHPRSTSRAVAEGGRETPASVFEGQEGRNKSHIRGKGSKASALTKSNTGTIKSHKDRRDVYEVDEPERGIMFTQDVARPGIVVTREYTVETERRRESQRSEACCPSEFGTGRPMRHNWDNV